MHIGTIVLLLEEKVKNTKTILRYIFSYSHPASSLVLTRSSNNFIARSHAQAHIRTQTHQIRNMQSSLTKSSSSFLISRQFQSITFSSSHYSCKKHSQKPGRKSSSSLVTKAGADEDELMQKLMAMIGGGAASGGRPLKGQIVAKENAIKGRDSEMRVTEEHYVLVRG